MDIDFLLGAGFGLLVVLIGWSDQIAGLRTSTRELEQRVLDQSGLPWEVLRYLVCPIDEVDPQKALQAVIKAIASGSLKTDDQAALLHEFQVANKTRARLTSILRWRFWLSFVLCSLLLLAAGLSKIFPGPIRCDSGIDIIDISAIPLSITLVVLLVLTGIVYSSETAFRSRLTSIDDELRENAADPERRE